MDTPTADDQPTLDAGSADGHGPDSATDGPDRQRPSRLPGGQAGDDPSPPDPKLWYRPDVLAILAAHDFAGLYRVLGEAGYNQREIGRMVGNRQSEVCDIRRGRRRVTNYDVLVRNATGLGIPRALMGLAWSDGGYPGKVTVAEPLEGVSAEMLRRHVLAFGVVTAFGAPIKGLDEFLDELPDPGAVQAPSHLDRIHVVEVQDLTRRLGEVGNSSQAGPEILSAAARHADRLLDLSGPESVWRALRVASAELHIEAGWAATEARLYARAMYHYARALDLATEVGDAYLQTLALRYAGLATMEAGHPNDALKMLQCGQVKAWKIPNDQERAVTVGVIGRAPMEAELLTSCAMARASLGHLVDAERDMATARDIWTPEPTDPFGDPNMTAARLALSRGRLDVAAECAMASVRRCAGANVTSRTNSGIVLATVYVRAGEPRSLQLAQDVIRSAAGLSSVRTRRRLQPLAVALERRPGAEAQELARMAQRVAA